MRFIRPGLCAVVAVASILELRAVAVEPPNTRPAVKEVWTRTELYFGSARANGEVTDAEFAEFVDRYITPRFPLGFTVVSGYGQFLGTSGILVKERSKVLILLYRYPSRATNRRIEEIRAKYKEVFGQTSVLRVDCQSMVSF